MLQGRAPGLQGGDGTAACIARQKSRPRPLAGWRQTGEDHKHPLRQRLGQMSPLFWPTVVIFPGSRVMEVSVQISCRLGPVVDFISLTYTCRLKFCSRKNIKAVYLMLV